MTSLPSVPDVPVDASPEVVHYLEVVKELLETREGLRGEGDERFITLADLQDLDLGFGGVTGNISELPLYTAASIGAPTNLTIEVGAWSNTLSWVNTTDEHLAGVEIYNHTTNDVSTATRVAMVGRNTNTYSHQVANVTQDQYYWIRSVSYAGKYSTWLPDVLQGGMLVPRKQSLGEKIDGVIDALLGEDPDLYGAGVAYQIDDLVRWQAPDGNIRRYRRRNYSIGVSGVLPSDTLHWERVGILMQGDVDGHPTVGIDGHLVVDQSILARSIQTDQLTVGDGSNGTIVMADGTITVQHVSAAAEDHLINSNQLWAEVTGDGKPANGATVGATWGTNIANRPTTLSGINSTEGNKLTGIATGADVTGSNTALNTANVAGLPASVVAGWRQGTTTYIDGGTIYTGTILAAAIGANQIVASKIAANQVTATHVGTNTIVASHANIANAVVTHQKIADATITAAKIGNAQITNALIGNAQVSTLKIQDNAVTVPVAAYTAASVNATSTWQTAQSIVMNSEGAPIMFFLNLVGYYSSSSGVGSTRDLDIRLYRGSTTYMIAQRSFEMISVDVMQEDTVNDVYYYSATHHRLYLSLMIEFAAPPTGNQTYVLQATGAYVSQRTLLGLGVKK